MKPKEKSTIFVSVHLNLMTIIIPATARLRSVWLPIPSTEPSVTGSTFWSPSEPRHRVACKIGHMSAGHIAGTILQNTIDRAQTPAFP